MLTPTQQIADLADRGFLVERLDCGFGPVPRAWVLLDADRRSLFIGDHGAVAPTRDAAIVEGYRRASVEVGT